MSEHKLKKGKEFIFSLKILGESLGYQVVGEFPLDQANQKSPAVDVAWLSEKDQMFPLMIFEVESALTNSATNNPLKVYGLENEEFEKPLFFFHVFLRGAKNSTKVKTLKRQYGTHNYRLYSLGDNETQNLLIDILSQHRRIQKEIDLINFLHVINEMWQEEINIDEIIIEIEKLGFDVKYLRSYAELSIEEPSYQKHFIRFLKTYDHNADIRKYPEYDTYMGDWYSDVLHWSLLINNDSTKRSEYLENLKYWQEESSYMKQLGHFFGLSRDYDIFILGFSPQLIVLAGCLCKEYVDAMNYLITMQKEIFDKVKKAFSYQISLFHALWLLHMANVVNNSVLYEELKSFINENGGIPKKFITIPHNNIALNNDEETEWAKDLNHDTEFVPDQIELTKLVKNRIGSTKDIYSAFDLVARVLTDNAVNGYWSKHIINALYT